MAPSAQGTTWNPGFCMASICLLRRESRSSSCTVKLGDFSWYCWKDESKVTKKQMDTCFQDDVSNRKCKFIIIHFGVLIHILCVQVIIKLGKGTNMSTWPRERVPIPGEKSRWKAGQSGLAQLCEGNFDARGHSWCWIWVMGRHGKELGQRLKS